MGKNLDSSLKIQLRIRQKGQTLDYVTFEWYPHNDDNNKKCSLSIIRQVLNCIYSKVHFKEYMTQTRISLTPNDLEMGVVIPKGKHIVKKRRFLLQ